MPRLSHAYDFLLLRFLYFIPFVCVWVFQQIHSHFVSFFGHTGQSGAIVVLLSNRSSL